MTNMQPAACANDHKMLITHLWWSWQHPSLLKRLVNNGGLHGLDSHRVLVDTQHTRTLQNTTTQQQGNLVTGPIVSAMVATTVLMVTGSWLMVGPKHTRTLHTGSTTDTEEDF